MNSVAGDVMRLTVSGFMAGAALEPWQLRFHYQCLTPGPQDPRTILAAAFDAAFKPVAQPCWYTDTSVQQYTCYRLGNAPVATETATDQVVSPATKSALAIVFASAPWDGTVLAGGSMASQLAAVISTRTNLPGRRHRGRVFFPSIPVSFQSGVTAPDAISGPAHILYETMANAIILVPLVGSDSSRWQHVIYSAPRVTPPVPAFVNETLGISVKFPIRTQRRRAFQTRIHRHKR